MDPYPPPRKRFGQNFLVDRGAVERIVSALDPRPGESVVEIGPGRGALTGALLARAGRMVAVELDRDLAQLLRSRFDPARLVLLQTDFLDTSLEEIATRAGFPSGAPLVLAGNLPFNISKPVAMKLVRERSWVRRAVLTFQREVALRLTAVPRTRAYGPLSVLVGEAFAVRRLFDLKPTSFRPAPAVVSSVTIWTPRPPAEFPPEAEAPLRACLAACFARRRRTLGANLRVAFAQDEARVSALLRAAQVDPGRRAEEISPESFRRLAELWPRDSLPE